MGLAARKHPAEWQADMIVRDGEEPFCGMSVLQREDVSVAHEQWHLRSEVVHRAAMETNRGRPGFLEGPARITRERGPATIPGEMQRMARVLGGIADLFTPGD